MKVFIISSASYENGKLSCHQIMTSESYEKAIELAQDNIAEDFGYDNWDEYLMHMDPEIIETDSTYSIYDCNCDHEESYMIETLHV